MTYDELLIEEEKLTAKGVEPSRPEEPTTYSGYIGGGTGLGIDAFMGNAQDNWRY